MTIGRGDGRGYLDAMERDARRRRAAARPRRARQPAAARSGRRSPSEFPLAGDGARPRRRADRPLALRRGARARARATTGRSGASRTRPGRRQPSSRRDVDGRPAHRLLRPPEREQADPAAARGVRAASASARPGARLLLVGAAAERFDLERRLERLGLGGDALIREDYVAGGAALVADGGLRRARQPALADDGRDVGRGDPRRSRSASRCSSPTSAGSPSCPTTSRSRSRSTSTRCATIAAALELAADHGDELGRGRPRLRRAASTTSTASPTPTSRALEEAAGGDAVADAVLWRIAEAAAEVGVDDAVASSRARAREAGLVAERRAAA